MLFCVFTLKTTVLKCSKHGAVTLNFTGWIEYLRNQIFLKFLTSISLKIRVYFWLYNENIFALFTNLAEFRGKVNRRIDL